MRRAVALGVLIVGLMAAESAFAGDVNTLAGRNPVGWGGTVRLTVATAAPVAPGIGAEIVRVADGAVVATGTTDASGLFTAPVSMTRAHGYYGRVTFPGEATPTVDPTPLEVDIKPRIRARVYGERVVGATLVLRGRVLPAGAGGVRLRVLGLSRNVKVNADGVFRTTIRTRTHAVVTGALRIVARAGYTTARRPLAIAMRRPALSLGSRGTAVLALERRLRYLRHVLRNVDGSFGIDTYQAVVAFQKIHGMSRTGRAGDALWRRVTGAGIPRARIQSGDHIEVSKTRQVMYEVLDGKVARIIHVSTGLTGNTPVGDWRSYRLGPGGSLSGMYYSVYFLRGFAIHGYHSVPNYPASHGCVRTPLWFAPGFYSRWGRIGVRIVVFG